MAEAKLMPMVLLVVVVVARQGTTRTSQEASARLARPDKGMMVLILHRRIALAVAVAVLGRRVLAQLAKWEPMVGREQAVQSVAVLWGMLAVAAAVEAAAT